MPLMGENKKVWRVHNGYPAVYNGYPGLTWVSARDTCVPKNENPYTCFPLTRKVMPNSYYVAPPEALYVIVGFKRDLAGSHLLRFSFSRTPVSPQHHQQYLDPLSCSGQ